MAQHKGNEMVQGRLYAEYMRHTPAAIGVDPLSIAPCDVGILAIMDQFCVYGLHHHDDYGVQEKAAMHNYAYYGEQVFSLSPLITEMFVHTDLGKTKLDDLKLPYGCFYISLEGSEWLDGFYVNHLKAPHSSNPIHNADTLAFVGVKFNKGHDKWDLKDWMKEMEPCFPDKSPSLWVQRQLAYHKYFFQIEINEETRAKSLGEIIEGVHSKPIIAPPHTKGDLDSTTAHIFYEEGGDQRWTAGHPEYQEEDIEIDKWGPTIPGISDIKKKGEWTDFDYCHALSGAMTRVALSLVLYLNTEDPSVETEDFRDEIEKAKNAVRGRSRKASKKAERKAARELLKNGSKATFHRVGEREEKEITSTPGFSFDQPRHWRKGHMAMRWTGPVKENGVRIPYRDWKAKRGQISRWLVPILINPEKEYIPGTNLTVIKSPEEDDSWMDELIQSEEGNRKPVTQSKIERNPKNRRKCIEFHGPHCYICGEDGEWLEDDALKLNKEGLPKGWLQCHHIEELSKTGPTKTDPEKDMIPLCADCHTMMHLTDPAMSVEEGIRMWKKREAYRAKRRAKRKGLKFWK